MFYCFILCSLCVLLVHVMFITKLHIFEYKFNSMGMLMLYSEKSAFGVIRSWSGWVGSQKMDQQTTVVYVRTWNVVDVTTAITTTHLWRVASTLHATVVKAKFRVDGAVQAISFATEAHSTCLWYQHTTIWHCQSSRRPSCRTTGAMYTTGAMTSCTKLSEIDFVLCGCLLVSK